MKKINKSSGAVSTILLILGVILIIVIIIVFVIIRVNSTKNANKEKEETESTQNNEPPPPVYETQLEDVKFTFVLAQDIGNVLLSEDKRFRPDLVSTEKFIRVVIGAQNKGKENIKKDTWDIGNMIDSGGRIFLSVDETTQGYYLSNSTGCGSLLKPEFEPIPCIKYYEVSKQSTGLKVEVNIYPENSLKKSQTALMDLIIE